MISLPEKFIQDIIAANGDMARKWVNNFDQLIRYCEKRWSLQVLSPFPLSFNFVAPVIFYNGLEAVLKLNIPRDEISLETAALRLYNGNGAVKLLDADDEKGILILERLKPGNTLKSIACDEEATRLAADVMKKIQTPVSNRLSFPSTSDWAEGLKGLRCNYDGGTGPIPERLVQKAEQLFPALNTTIRTSLLLHGDLHHDNILSAEREPWLAIDPQGVIGEAEYGVIPFLMNHLPEEQPIETIRRRVNIFVTELGLSKERVLQWALCHATLSSWWCIEGNNDEYVHNDIQIALMFEQLLNESK